jgi:hypothetical protein
MTYLEKSLMIRRYHKEDQQAGICFKLPTQGKVKSARGPRNFSINSRAPIAFSALISNPALMLNL